MSVAMSPNPVPHSPVRKNLFCPSCGSELLTFHEQHENICGRLACRGAWLQRRAAAEKETIRAEQAALVDAALECLRETSPDVCHRNESGQLRLIALPAFDTESATQPGERIAAFHAMLEELMVEAQETTRNEYRVRNLLSSYEPREKDQSSLAILNACSTCRGQCCRMGHRHAFITAEFLAWRLVHEPDADPEAIIDEYINRIPEQSMNDSCLYHTTTGCAMPRELRSGTCNDFLCLGFQPHLASIQEDPHQPTVAVAFDGDQFVRFGVTNSDGNRTENPLDAHMQSALG